MCFQTHLPGIIIFGNVMEIVCKTGYDNSECTTIVIQFKAIFEENIFKRCRPKMTHIHLIHTVKNITEKGRITQGATHMLRNVLHICKLISKVKYMRISGLKARIVSIEGVKP